FKCPTIVNNVASLAAVPYILRKGAKTYAAMGTEKSTGTFVFSISGHVNKPGTYEVPMGISFMEFLDKYAGGVSGGKKMKALIPGGSSTPVLTAEECLDLMLDYESCAAKKTMLGSGAIIVLAE